MWEMVELKDCQQQEMEGKLQFHSCLMLMNTRSHLWKFTTWMFVCRGLMVVYTVRQVNSHEQNPPGVCHFFLYHYSSSSSLLAVITNPLSGTLGPQIVALIFSYPLNVTINYLATFSKPAWAQPESLLTFLWRNSSYSGFWGIFYLNY